MVELERDIETVPYLRRKAVLHNALYISLMLLGSALYRFYSIGLQQEWLPIIFIGIGSALLSFWLCMKLTGWVSGGNSTLDRKQTRSEKGRR